MKIKVFRCRVCGEVYIGEKKPKTCPFCGAHESYFVPAKKWSLLGTEKISDTSRDDLRKALDLELDNTNFYKAASEKSQDIYFTGMFKGLSKIER